MPIREHGEPAHATRSIAEMTISQLETKACRDTGRLHFQLCAIALRSGAHCSPPRFPFCLESRSRRSRSGSCCR
ncbi:hypothetical protein PSAB6_70157 [Paraburkholderia sabiae]|nr:hypothetical protein PSAB6_70157 [Paraburkholderia sabiae]